MKADLKDETRSKHHADKILFALLQQRLAEHEFVLRRARVIDELEKCLFLWDAESFVCFVAHVRKIIFTFE